MSKNVAALEPQIMWKNFVDLNAVPRPSKKEERVIKFMEDFGARLGLPTKTDACGNVLISKTCDPRNGRSQKGDVAVAPRHGSSEK